ncbi:MAG: hypothetical protein CL842_12820 [Crocinitomicaceae bacterium]|nr:hypothetical protein [Crocinitomicaceae bacterium]|tara:strand:- start:648 stop:875 length:228 start_codon:yes stop_codon:yes gene_type:complete
MKKVLMVLSISLFLFSCGPSACDCNKNARKWGIGGSISMTQDCVEKYRDDIPKNYVGTNKFNEELIRLSGKECND